MAWAPDYVTASELKAFLRIGDTVDDTQVGFAISAASRAIDQAANRQFGLVAAPEERVYTARYDRRLCRWVVEIDDLMTVTGLHITTEAGEVDGYALQPGNAEFEGKPWTRLVVHPDSAVTPDATEDGVTVTASFGWTTVPLAIKQAAVFQASRFFKRRDAAFGVAGSPELGSELRLLAKVDPDVAVVLGPYTRWWGAV